MLDSPSESTKSQYPFVSPNRSEEIKMTMVPKNIVRMRTSENIFRTTNQCKHRVLEEDLQTSKEKDWFQEKIFSIDCPFPPQKLKTCFWLERFVRE